MQSNSVTRRVRVDTDGVGPAVADLWRGGGYDAVIPGTDDDLLSLAQRFDGAAPPGVPSVSGATAVLDRNRIAAAALAAGLDWPDLIPCTTAAELRAACGAAGFPVMLKPVDVVVTRDDLVVRLGAHRADDLMEAFDAVRKIGWPVHVQKVIPGSVGSLGGLAIAGRLAACVATENVRIWPPDAGNASAAITVVPRADLVVAMGEIVRSLGHEGMFQLEYITQADGSISPIDLNPRPYGSLALAIAAGADLPGLWVDWLVEGRVPAETIVGRSGVRFRWETSELRYAARAARLGQAATVASILRPHRRTAHVVASVRDPGPMAVLVLAGVRDFLRGIARRPR